MSKIQEMRERFLLDDLPHRVGGIASNLARIQSISEFTHSRASVVRGVIDETLLFIDLIVNELDSSHVGHIRELAADLNTWISDLDATWTSVPNRLAIGERAGQWSDSLLEISGLLHSA